MAQLPTAQAASPHRNNGRNGNAAREVRKLRRSLRIRKKSSRTIMLFKLLFYKLSCFTRTIMVIKYHLCDLFSFFLSSSIENNNHSFDPLVSASAICSHHRRRWRHLSNIQAVCGYAGVSGMQHGVSLQDNDTPEGFQRGCLSDTPIFWPAIFGEFASRTSPKGVMYIFGASKGNGAPVSGVTTPMTS